MATPIQPRDVNAEQRHKCQEALDPSVVQKKKTGQCRHNNSTTCAECASYLPQHYVEEQLNAVFGADGWDPVVVDQKLNGGMAARLLWSQQEGKKVLQTVATGGCITTLELRLRWADGRQTVKHGIGVASKFNYRSDVPEAIGDAAKAAFTDAVKRAAKQLGPRFGASLYDKHNPIHKGQLDSHGEHPEPDPPNVLRRAADKLIRQGIAGEEVDRVFKLFTPDGVPESVHEQQIDACMGELQSLARRAKEAIAA